jgi:hypothetical protein
MPEHLVDSPTHGALQVVTTEGEFPHGRTWRAVLDPRPPRLAHLVAVDGTSEEEALKEMARAVEQYDATGVVLRKRERYEP